MKEILRFRPPAVFVPHEVPEDSPINSQYKVKKGTIILPSVWHSSFEGYENADKVFFLSLYCCGNRLTLRCSSIQTGSAASAVRTSSMRPTGLFSALALTPAWYALGFFFSFSYK
jgi:hypothetical protein